MRNLKRTTTAIALTAGLSLSAVAPAVADDNDGDRTREVRNDIVRDVQGNSGDTQLWLEQLAGDLDAEHLLGIGDVTGTGDNAFGNQTGNVTGNQTANGSGNGNLSGNDVGGVGNDNDTEVGNGDVHVQPEVNADPDADVDPHVDAEGGDDGDVVDDDSYESQTHDGDDRREGDREQGDLLGGLL